MIDFIVSLFELVFWIFSPVIFAVSIILVQIFIRIMYKVNFKKFKIPKTGTFNNGNFFVNVFYRFPQQYVIDFFAREDYEFREYGLHMVCGQQGSGKTTTVVFLLDKWQQLYPKMKIATNLAYKHEHGQLNHWNELVGRQNGVLGQVEVIDEIQTWFSSNQSKDFPPEMLTEVSQQRKQRKAIVGTAQVFSRISKPIREQTSFVHLPFTIGGCLTVVRVSKPEYWNDEEQKFSKYIKYYYFVHTPKLRDSFDTYKKIDGYNKVGFKPDIVRISSNQ